MNRTDAFRSLADHPWFGKRFAQLKGEAKKAAEAFLQKHENATHDEFIPAVNRMFLDMPAKPKNWELCTELLTAASCTVEQQITCALCGVKKSRRFKVEMREEFGSEILCTACFNRMLEVKT